MGPVSQPARDAMWVLGALGPAPCCAPGQRAVGALAARLNQSRLEPGAVLFRAGKAPRGVWVITGGSVELAVKSGTARRVIQILRAGDTVGDAYLLLDLIPPCTARTLEQTACFFIAADEFSDLLAQDASICAVWLYNLAARIAQSRIRILELLGTSLRQRVASVLTEEADHGYVRLPQATLAQLLGAQRTSLNKVLRGLEGEGLIDLGYGRIRLKDEDELLSIASSGDDTLASFLSGAKK